MVNELKELALLHLGVGGSRNGILIFWAWTIHTGVYELKIMHYQTMRVLGYAYPQVKYHGNFYYMLL